MYTVGLQLFKHLIIQNGFLHDTIGRLFMEGYKFCRFRGFWGLPLNLFHRKLRKFYRDTDCRLKRRHQCRFLKIVSSTSFLIISPFAKFVAFKKIKVPYGKILHVYMWRQICFKSLCILAPQVVVLLKWSKKCAV